MFIHIGDNLLLEQKDIIAILEWETEEDRNVNIGFYQHWLAEEKPVVFCREKDKIKSLVLTDDKIYFSAISCQTLKKRSDKGIHILEEL